MWNQRQLRLLCTQIQYELPVELVRKILAHLLEDRFEILSLPPRSNRTLQELQNNLTRRAITNSPDSATFLHDQQILKRQAFKVIRRLSRRLLEQWVVLEDDRRRPERMQQPDECALPWIKALNLETTSWQLLRATKTQFLSTVLKNYGDEMRKLKQAHKERGAAEGYLMALKSLPPNESLPNVLAAQQERVNHLGKECIKLQRAMLKNRSTALIHYFARNDRCEEAVVKQTLMRGQLMARVREHNHLAKYFFE